MNNMIHPPHTGANSKLTHDMHAFRNLNYGSSGQFNNANQPLSYPPYSSQSFNNNSGHYSVCKSWNFTLKFIHFSY